MIWVIVKLSTPSDEDSKTEESSPSEERAPTRDQSSGATRTTKDVAAQWYREQAKWAGQPAPEHGARSTPTTTGSTGARANESTLMDRPTTRTTLQRTHTGHTVRRTQSHGIVPVRSQDDGMFATADRPASAPKQRRTNVLSQPFRSSMTSPAPKSSSSRTRPASPKNTDRSEGGIGRSAAPRRRRQSVTQEPRWRPDPPRERRDRWENMSERDRRSQEGPQW